MKDGGTRQFSAAERAKAEAQELVQLFSPEQARVLAALAKSGNTGMLALEPPNPNQAAQPYAHDSVTNMIQYINKMAQE